MLAEMGDQTAIFGFVHHYNHEQQLVATALQACLHGFTRLSRPYEAWPKGPKVGEEAGNACQMSTFQTLLERLSDTITMEKYQMYLLELAVAHCPVEVVQAIICKGLDLGTTVRNRPNVLVMVAQRSKDSYTVLAMLLAAEPSLLTSGVDWNAILTTALSFFELEGTRTMINGPKRSFHGSDTVQDVLEKGPGAVVRKSLSQLLYRGANDPRYILVLQVAAQGGEYDFVQLLVERGVDVNSPGCYYGTAIQAAARIGDMAIVELLLSAGADVILLMGSYDTALRAAVRGSHLEVTKLLLRQGANANLRLKTSKSIVHLALYTDDVALLGALLHAGTEVDIHRECQPHPLITVIKKARVNMVHALLLAGADVNTSGTKVLCGRMTDGETSPLHMACSEGNTELVRLFLDRGAEFDKTVEQSQTALYIAACAGHPESVGLLLDFGADVSHENGRDALPVVSSKGYVEIVQEMLTRGSRRQDASSLLKALFEAFSANRDDISELLLERVQELERETAACDEELDKSYATSNGIAIRLLVNRLSASPERLVKACAAGSLDAVQAYIHKGVAMDIESEQHSPPLHKAAYYLQTDVVSLLVEDGADVNLVSETHSSPLVAALEGRAAPLLDLLDPIQPWVLEPFNHCRRLDWIDAGTGTRNEKYKPGYQQTINCEQIVKFLIDRGADVNFKSRYSGSALYLASFNGNDNLVKLFLDNGANINSRGGGGSIRNTSLGRSAWKPSVRASQSSGPITSGRRG